MEIKEILEIINKRKFELILWVMVCIFSVLFYECLKPAEYVLVNSIDIGWEVVNQSKACDEDDGYTFDNTKVIVTSVDEWLRDVNVVNKIKAESNLSNANDLLNLSSRRVSDTTVRIEWTAKSRKGLEKVNPAIKKVLQEKLDQVNGDPNISYKIYIEEGVISEAGQSILNLLIFGSGVGFLLGFMYILVIGYFDN